MVELTAVCRVEIDLRACDRPRARRSAGPRGYGAADRHARIDRGDHALRWRDPAGRLFQGSSLRLRSITTAFARLGAAGTGEIPSPDTTHGEIPGSAIGGILVDKSREKLTLRRGRTYRHPVSRKDLRSRSPEYLTVAEAAILLDVHPKTVERACRRGDIPASRKVSERSVALSGKGQGQAWQIARADLYQAMLSGFGAPTKTSPALRPELKAQTVRGTPRRRRAFIRSPETRAD
jgi:hypothetical protein